MNYNKLGLVIIAIFSIFGAIMFTILIHEYTHKYDLREVSKDGVICLFEIGGDYSGSYTSKITDLEAYNNIEPYLELRAYAISIIFGVLFSLGLISTIKHYSELEK